MSTIKLSGNRASVVEQVEALETLEGYPLAPTHVGRACRHLVPEVYSPGALGWAERLIYVPEHDEDGRPLQTVEVELPDVVVDRHEGKTARLRDGKEVTVRVRGQSEEAPGRDTKDPPSGGEKDPPPRGGR